MSDDRLELSSGWLALPLFLAYTIWTLLYGVVGLTSWATLGMVLAALPLVGVVTRRAEGFAWLAPPVGVLLGFLLGLLGLTTLLGSDSAGLGVLGGVLMGFPLAVVAAILRWGRQASVLFIVTLGGVVDVLTTHAALVKLASEGVGRTPVGLTIASGQVTYDQLTGFASLFAGTTSVDLPLQSLGDIVFAALILLALVGAFLAFFHLEGPDGRSLPVDPPALLGPVAMGVLGAAGFEIVAARDPRFALLLLAIAVLAVVSLILVLARPRRSQPVRRSEETPETPSEGGPDEEFASPAGSSV